MIYSFFDVGPDARKGLGTFIILDHIIRAARAGLPYVYLGYWVDGSPRMAYKTSFRPLERLGRDGWRRMDRAEVEARRPSSRRAGSSLIDASRARRREPAASELAASTLKTKTAERFAAHPPVSVLVSPRSDKLGKKKAER